MSTNLHIDDIGNLILRDGKLGLFISSQYVTPPHYGGGRVGALSLYAYCAGDPVNLIDPTGEDVYNVLTFYINGVQTVYIFRQETDDKYDMVYVDGDNQGLKLTDQNIMKGLWASQSTITAKDLKKNSQRCSTIWTSSKNENEVMSLFYYLADNSNVEWSASKYKDGTLAIGGFSLHHNKQGVKGSAPARYNQVQTIDNEVAHIHSHPESEDSSFQDRESYSNNRRLTDKIKQNKGDFSVTTVNDVSSQYLYKKSGNVFFLIEKGQKVV